MNKDFEFLSINVDEIRETLRKGYLEIVGGTLEKGDPMSDFIDYTTYIVTLLSEKINETGKQNLLRYATRTALDELGMLVGEERGKSRPATTTIRYTFSKSFNTVVTIPKGHKTEINGIYFTASFDTDLKIGDKIVDVPCECSLDGTIGNDIEVGEIKNIVDPIPYLAKVNNITTSEGGAETEEDETLRERIRTNPTSKSVAGPETAYVYHTKKSHHDICDVSITTVEGTGVVNIYPLLKNGVIPGAEILAVVKNHLENKEIKPLTDIVNCVAPSAVGFNVDLTYYTYSENFLDVNKVKNDVEEAIIKYIEWQSEKLGRDINPDQLKKLVMNAGAKRCEIRSPIYSVLNRQQVAKISEKTILYGGIENE